MKNSITDTKYGIITSNKFNKQLKKIITDEKPEYMMVAFDKGKTFRHEKYTTYKGTRAETPDDLKKQFK